MFLGCWWSDLKLLLYPLHYMRRSQDLERLGWVTDGEDWTLMEQQIWQRSMWEQWDLTFSSRLRVHCKCIPPHSNSVCSEVRRLRWSRHEHPACNSQCGSRFSRCVIICFNKVFWRWIVFVCVQIVCWGTRYQTDEGNSLHVKNILCEYV